MVSFCIYVVFTLQTKGFYNWRMVYCLPKRVVFTLQTKGFYNTRYEV